VASGATSGAGDEVVVFSGGGTGGHLYPALALAAALVEERPEVRPFFIGATRGIEARVLPQRGLDHLLLPVEGFHRGELGRNRSLLTNLWRSLRQVSGTYRDLQPSLTVVTGGYAGGPAGLASAAMGVPLALQEQNAAPGVTTRALSLVARQIHLAFPEARDRLPGPARKRAVVTGNPVRPPVAVDLAEARAGLGLPPSGTVLLVVGGSQGSIALNQIMLEVVRGVGEGVLPRPGDLTCLWATGPGHHSQVMEALAGLPSTEWVALAPYLDDMPKALAVADLAISRAGAMATSEFTAWGVPAVLIPLPTAAGDHQRLNAEALESAGAALNLPQAGLNGEGLWARVSPLLMDAEARSEMAGRARERGRPGAAREIAQSLALLTRSGRREAA
jgi:UDP-N-acetylglucosamine--N-acetylmuramyl-(pentapeptide) pyrophosphoryl-undecaprenol N-acetylglucosamine transferase